MATRPSGRSLLPLTSVALFLCVCAGPAAAGGSRHPHFDDRGTLTWYASLAEAQRAARRQRKLVFIEFGREKCSNCRKLAEDVLPHRRLRVRMGRTTVGLAAECDRPERAVAQLFRTHLRGARALPFVAFITPDGRWITGWSGGIATAEAADHLDIAERALRRVRPRRQAQAAKRPLTSARRSPRTAAARRRVYPAPPPPPEVLAALKASAGAAHGNTPDCNAVCVGDDCRPPSLDLPCLPSPLEVLTRSCKPKACKPKPCTPTPPRPDVAGREQGFCSFPPPQPRKVEPRKRSARHTSPASGAIAPAAPAPQAQAHAGFFLRSADGVHTVEDLLRPAAEQVGWEQAWSLFRAAGAAVDARTGRAKTP
jgi:hypothetical protein